MAMRTTKNAEKGAMGDAKKPKSAGQSCTCSAYSFPHRPGSGKCKEAKSR